MKLNAAILILFLAAFASVISLGQDRSTGGIKGKVRVETGTPAGVSVVIRQGEREIGRVVTDRNGGFLIQRLSPGAYGLTFRKAGLSVGTIEGIDVKAGKTRSLGDRLILTIDEGSIAFIRGSVFNEDGKSVPGARVELAKVLDDNTAKKIDGRITNETGSFVFRLTPDKAKYRITVKADRTQPAAKDVEVEGAAVYRVALSLPAAPK